MYKYLLFVGVSLGAVSPVFAQDHSEAYSGLEITVVATGSNEPVQSTGLPISIISSEEIASVQGADLTRILRRAPGVTITRNGGVGSFTGVRIRGAEAEQLLVIVDGVRLADQASPGGGFDFGNLLPGTIGKIELLRGSNSTIWGSQAIGGVLAITSNAENGLSEITEYGSRDTFYAARVLGINRDRLNASLSGSYFKTDGFSSAANGTENDGFRQWQAGGRIDFAVSDSFGLFGAGRYADGRLDIDGFSFTPPYGLIDSAEFQKTKEASGLVGARYSAGDLRFNAAYSAANIERSNFDPAVGPAPGFASKGESRRAELRGSYEPGGVFSVKFGGEKEWSAFSTSFDSRKTANIAGAYTQVGLSSGGLTVNAGVRADDHSDFGSAVSFGADASYALQGGWRVRGSFGEGFKAPTLFQLFSDYGNTALQPERSRSYDIGVEHGDRNQSPVFFALSAFRRNTSDQIDFVSCFGVVGGICTGRPYGTYDNVGRARAEGFELELSASISERLRGSAAYSYVKTQNRSAGSFNEGNDLARRPRQALSASLDWTGPGAIQLGVDARMVGDSFDDAGNFTRLDGFALADIRASVPVSRRFELYGRVENVTDTEYQTAAGYGTGGRGAYVGVRAKF